MYRVVNLDVNFVLGPLSNSLTTNSSGFLSVMSLKKATKRSSGEVMLKFSTIYSKKDNHNLSPGISSLNTIDTTRMANIDECNPISFRREQAEEADLNRAQPPI